ncbi:MAG: SMC-Scp complex subunit ScpB [Solirubrobacterales bacterium]|nr:SMC-Scp complex subunit ScpB [Solirubrobacterales bacterium]
MRHPVRVSPLARTIEALLFLSPEPVAPAELCEAAECDQEELDAALEELREAYAPGSRGIELRELAGGFTLATSPDSEPAARRLLAKPRTPPLTPAQAETLAIVAYLQPVSRPEITRIRGVSADSAAATLLERGLVEEAGRSPFGAVLYRTTPLFLKLFGLSSLEELPDVEQWDPTPDEAAELRDRLLKAGEARTGGQHPPADPTASADGEAIPGAPTAGPPTEDAAEAAPEVVVEAPDAAEAGSADASPAGADDAAVAEDPAAEGRDDDAGGEPSAADGGDAVGGDAEGAEGPAAEARDHDEPLRPPLAFAAPRPA